MRAVFDTNAVISALVVGHRLARLPRACASGSVVSVVCRETAAELLRVLAVRKFQLDAASRDLLLADYRPFAETSPLPGTLPPLPLACQDRDGRVVPHLAIRGRADFLVSRDADLTVLGGAYAVILPSALQERVAPL